MKDAVATMGTILPEDAGGRDAVHVAVFSAVAEVIVFPSQIVGLVRQGEPDCVVEPMGHAPFTAVGLVDPFLSGAGPIQPGNRFWVYLLPRTITGLAHRWTHPAFEASESTYATPNAVAISERWIRSFVQQADCPGFEEVMAAAARVADGLGDRLDDERLHFRDVEAHGEIPPEFWDHAEVVLGRPIKGTRATYFSCGC